MNSKLTVKAKAEYQTLDQWKQPHLQPSGEQVIKPGTIVDYVSHTVGGMIKVRHEGQTVVIHPGATAELS